MLEHILGKPSANVRRVQVACTVLAAAAVLRRKKAPWGLGWAARWERRVALWKLVVGWIAAQYVVEHMDDLLGLNAPEGLRGHYSRSFYRATWVFTALDAGFWTAMWIRPKALRDVLSLVFSLYYLVFAGRGAEKVRKVRALITVDHLRVSWEKGEDNAVLRALRRWHTCRLSVERVVMVPAVAHAGTVAPALCHVMYAGAAENFSECRAVVLDIPGGGFVGMGPRSHSDYLSAWAQRTGAVVVSVDYGKAPEYPFPYAIDQCYAVYRELVQSNGRCIGLRGDPGERLRVVLAGDSAGGNIAASLMFRILESNEKLPVPDGIVFVYGCFNVDIRAWMTREETRALLGAVENARLESLADPRDHLHHASPLAITSRDDGYQQQRFRRRAARTVDSRVRVVQETGAAYVPLTMGSSFTYFSDRVLSPEMMRAMILMYVGPRGRPDFRTDYYLSPLVAPEHLLARFPPVYFMCGEKDPLVDDTVLFAARIRAAKKKAAGSALSENDNTTASAAKNDESGGYGEYRASSLYRRRHSQPRTGPAQFFIDSTEVSEDEGDRNAQAAVPPGLRMTQMQRDHSPRHYNHSQHTRPLIKVKLVAGMSHGFMQMYSLLPESKRVANVLGDWLCELLDGSHSFSDGSRCASAVDTTNINGLSWRHGINYHHSGDTLQTDENDECFSDAAGQNIPSIEVTAALPVTNQLQDHQHSLLTKSIFDKGLVDRYGIEVVSATNMVRRRGHGLADPLN